MGVGQENKVSFPQLGCHQVETRDKQEMYKRAGIGGDLPSVGRASAAETGTCEHLVHRHKTSRRGRGTAHENRQASLKLGPETGSSVS